ncbi:MAG: hypothetical protein Q4F00_05015 [bacterium]|nr:hypothetical protein [bacterium]
MSDAISTDSGRADLGRDVANTVATMGDVNALQFFREFFPCRNLTPRGYASHHLLKHKVKYVFVALGEAIPKRCPQGCELLIVSGISFAYRDLEKLIEQMKAAETGARVLLGIPTAPLNVINQIRELLALRKLAELERYAPGTPAGDMLRAQDKYVRQHLKEGLRSALLPSSFHWLYQGNNVEDLPTDGRDSFVSAFLQRLYSASPEMRLGCSRRHCLEALDEVLDLNHTLQISNLDNRGSFKALRRFMVNSGIFMRIEDCGSYSRYEVNEYIPSSEWTDVWRHITERLLGDGVSERCVDLGAFSDELRQAPWGIPRIVQALLLGAMLRREHSRLSLELNGNKQKVSGRELYGALAESKGWQVSFQPANPHEMAFLSRIREIFAVDQPLIEGMFANIWDRTLRAISSWYHGLPGVAKLNKETMSSSAQQFVELINDAGKRENPAEFLGTYLPQLNGQAGIPPEDEQEDLLKWIANCKCELEQRTVDFQNKLCQVLASVLGRKASPVESSVQWFDEQFKSWLNRLHYGSDQCELSAHSNALRRVYNLAVTPEERWLTVVPQQLGIPPLKNWNRDMTALYKASFAKCCVELQTWSVYQIAPWAISDEERSAKIASWMAGTFAGMKIKKDQREAVILNMIEQIV